MKYFNAVFFHAQYPPSLIFSSLFKTLLHETALREHPPLHSSHAQTTFSKHARGTADFGREEKFTAEIGKNVLRE